MVERSRRKTEHVLWGEFLTLFALATIVEFVEISL